MLFYHTRSMLKEILNDTLKRDGKWSSTLFTMLSAWTCAIIYGWVDYIEHGYRSECFWAFVTIGAGIKITDAFSKKIKPTIV